MIKTCWFATLRDIGYSTELSVTNPLPCQGIPAQSLKLQLRLFKNASPVAENPISIGTLAPGARINIDIEQILNNHSIKGSIYMNNPNYRFYLWVLRKLPPSLRSSQNFYFLLNSSQFNSSLLGRLYPHTAMHNNGVQR